MIELFWTVLAIQVTTTIFICAQFERQARLEMLGVIFGGWSIGWIVVLFALMLYANSRPIEGWAMIMALAMFLGNIALAKLTKNIEYRLREQRRREKERSLYG